MYTPAPFVMSDPQAIGRLMADHPFAVLMMQTDNGLEATHVPFVLDPDRGPHGTLLAHLARPNPLLEACDGAHDALVVFSGPQAYISPDWYGEENTVPTWNYLAVHCHGRPVVSEDDGLMALLDQLSAQEEGRLLPKTPWTSDKMDAKLYQNMRRGIRGIAMEITRIEAKVKLNQNHSEARRKGAIQGLRARGRENDLTIANLMEALG